MIIQENEGLCGKIKQEIELKIISGEYRAGERIPPVRKIAEIYNVGMSTATKTLALMCADGIIYQRRGVGYFVKPYIKENLMEEHRKKLEKLIVNAFEYAELINADPMVIINGIKQH